MSDALEPYVRRNANDLIRAADWNDIQIRTRQDIQTHVHTGGAQGAKLTGDAIDPSAVLTVQNATVSGKLTVHAREVLAEIDGILARIKTLETNAVARGPAGEVVLAEKELRLRGSADGNHVLRWAGAQAFGNLTVDGPALYGFSGGILGTTSGQPRVALAWDSNGRIGMGTPVSTNQLDISNGTRTDTHGTQMALYVSANSSPAAGGVEFRHLNGSQGIGFGYNTIYATGSTANQDLTLQPRGTGSLTVTSGMRLGNSDIYFSRTDHSHTGIGNTQGWAAIENSSAHNALMILGRSQTNPLRRVVKLWDMLEINGGSNDANNPPFKVNHSNGQANITIGHQQGPYVGDAIYGLPNLWLNARDKVFIKQGYEARGMDIAERFPATEPLHAGDVVVFDPAHKAITACDREADRRAVGIVSEAPAFIMGTLVQEEPAVALCGRVPCKVDADFAPIAPGDLLTTSPTRGHARKADPARSVGAIIGKALEPLDSGRGEILVFVAMQ
jgi:hypothetical protein